MIRLLDDETINKIAAGEVIERPASVVKELVENSIDAGARRVVIEVRGSGREFMRVTDDGCGMTRDDAVLAFERHATSKIVHAGDLFSISTLGFRGEALPSIASVARVELLTRPAASPSAVGTRVEIEGGRRVQVADAGAPPGTTVTVRDLFFNTPARLKYLRSDATEFQRVCDIVMRLALAHPEVAIKFSRDGHQVLTSPGRGDHMAAIAASFGTGVAKSLIRFAAGESRMEIMGFVGRPDFSRARRDAQCFFVNGRSIWSAVLQRAVDNALGRLIPQGRHAVAFIWLNVDPSCVDVNVHPTKREVKFEDEAGVYRMVFNAIHSAVQSFTATPSITAPGTRVSISDDSGRDIYRAGQGYTARQGYATGRLLERPAAGGTRRAANEAPELDAGYIAAGHVRDAAANVTDAGVDTRGLARLVEGDVTIDVLAQFKMSYIVAEAGDALVLIDQHAAHERVIYEGLLERRLRGGPELHESPTQPLLIPIPIPVTPVIAAFFEDNKNRDEFRKMGFDLEPFGRDSLLLRAVPAILGRFPGGGASEAVVDAIQSLGDHEMVETMAAGARDQLAPRLERFAAQVACKAAIKAGIMLAAEEMRQLVADLLLCRDPYSCPHGRPTLIRFELDGIEKSFRRR
ncbi:MAG TPA: DNA mismatch repair endonuclease MutL [Firmicutes bacterium]|nr:DNA mismatch repair endonuclease MutL [Bacillota bacterium]